MEGETIYFDLATLCEPTGLPLGERAAAKARAADSTEGRLSPKTAQATNRRFSP
jgi:hypothetical protein